MAFRFQPKFVVNLHLLFCSCCWYHLPGTVVTKFRTKICSIQNMRWSVQHLGVLCMQSIFFSFIMVFHHIVKVERTIWGWWRWEYLQAQTVMTVTVSTPHLVLRRAWPHYARGNTGTMTHSMRVYLCLFITSGFNAARLFMKRYIEISTCFACWCLTHLGWDLTELSYWIKIHHWTSSVTE